MNPNMYFYHSDAVWDRFPTLSALTMVLRGVRATSDAAVDIDTTLDQVAAQLDRTAEGELPSIQAWRQAYSTMGLKPTQYRCAAEALLRRFRKDRELPRFHPLIDTLNAESMHAAIPIAAFDCAHIVDGITVRPATGTESRRPGRFHTASNATAPSRARPNIRRRTKSSSRTQPTKRTRAGGCFDRVPPRSYRRRPTPC